MCIARLEGHRLMFHKKGMDSSGKCDIEYTADSDHCVWGVVFKIPKSEKPVLDKKEGLGGGYAEKSVHLISRSGEPLKAITYFALEIDSGLKPYHWYKEHVLRGAMEHHLPTEYINSLQAVASMADPNPRNHERELSIYQ